jgi:hypothetical protein
MDQWRFFVCEPSLLDYSDGDDTSSERAPRRDVDNMTYARGPSNVTDKITSETPYSRHRDG